MLSIHLSSSVVFDVRVCEWERGSSGVKGAEVRNVWEVFVASCTTFTLCWLSLIDIFTWHAFVEPNLVWPLSKSGPLKGRPCPKRSSYPISQRTQSKLMQLPNSPYHLNVWHTLERMNFKFHERLSYLNFSNNNLALLLILI